jgi:hypothetical protein
LRKFGNSVYARKTSLYNALAICKQKTAVVHTCQFGSLSLLITGMCFLLSFEIKLNKLIYSI